MGSRVVTLPLWRERPQHPEARPGALQLADEGAGHGFELAGVLVGRNTGGLATVDIRDSAALAFGDDPAKDLGLDVVSAGGLIHQATWIDLSMNLHALP